MKMVETEYTVVVGAPFSDRKMDHRLNHIDGFAQSCYLFAHDDWLAARLRYVEKYGRPEDLE